MKFLRALTKPMLSEIAERQDFSFARPGEILSIPKLVCPESGSNSCHCHRVFVGLESGNPATLAVVCEDEPEFIADETGAFDNLSDEIITDQNEDIVLHGLSMVADTLRRLEVGSIIRVNHENGILSLSAW